MLSRYGWHSCSQKKSDFGNSQEAKSALTSDSRRQAENLQKPGVDIRPWLENLFSQEGQTSHGWIFETDLIFSMLLAVRRRLNLYNCRMYLCQIAKCLCVKLQNVFVSNCKMYLSQIAKCIFWPYTLHVAGCSGQDQQHSPFGQVSLPRGRLKGSSYSFFKTCLALSVVRQYHTWEWGYQSGKW